MDDLKSNFSLYKPDILCVVETWLDDSIDDSEISIPGYHSLRLDRNRHGGGIAIYISELFSFSIISKGPNSLEFLSVCVNLVSSNVGLSLLYRPPSSPVSFFDNLYSALDNLDIPLYSNFLLFGDFNIDISAKNPLYHHLCSVIDQFSLTISPTGPTRITSLSKTTIDLMLSSSPELTGSCSTIPPIGTSDHHGLLASVSLKGPRPKPAIQRKVWRYEHANFPLANELLANLDPSDILVDNDPNISWNKWCNAFLDIMHRCIPSALLPNRRNLPWLSKKIIQLMRKRNSLFRRSKKCPSFTPKYKKVRNAVTKALRDAKRNFFYTLRPSQKDFWKAINSLNRGRTSIPTLISSDGTPASSPASKAALLNHRFSKNFNSSTPPITSGDILPQPPFPCPDELLCSVERTFELICSLDANKAMGLDKISARMLKETASSISPMVSAIFNISLSTGTLPDTWKSSLVVPVPKSGDPTNPDNYRPISLLPIVSKVLEKHICDLLLDHFNISDEQWGFQAGKSTANAILSATNEWFIHLENGLEVQAVFFDLQKAFDSVPHCLLIDKLHRLEVPSHLIRWISSYLHNRIQQVGVLGELSCTTSVISGVPQGSVLGPLLFLIYIDGLSGIQLSGGTIVLFADDLLLHRVITCTEDLACIQNDIDELCNWLSSYKLTLNPRKCKSLLISRKRLQTVSHTMYVDGNALERVSSYRYLGIMISSDLAWSNHIQAITTKARRQIGLLYRRFYKHAHPDTLRSLYVSLIRPHLEYAVPVWDPHLRKDIDSLESVQRFATKVCTKTWNTTHYEDRLESLQLDTLRERRTYLKQCHLFKLVHGLSIFPNCPISFSHSSHSSTRSNHSLSLHVPFSHSNAYFNSFFCDAPRTWNSLPYSALSSSGLGPFKRKMVACL